MGYKRWTKSAEQLKPDTRYDSDLVSKFINSIMHNGKKSTATRLFYDAMDIVSKRVKDIPPNEIFEQAVKKCKPDVQVRSKRVGGSNYQVPMPVSSKRQQTLSVRWLLEAVRTKKGRPTHLALSEELMNAYRREGAAMTKRDNVHRMADANKAFAHFAW